jgi:hypothetical protein
VTVLVALVAVVFLSWSNQEGVILDEDFASGSPGFSTESDQFVDLTIVDDAYRVELKDVSAPQLMRHIFDDRYDGLRFESTVTQVAGSGDSFFSLGCWDGANGYTMGITPNGLVALVEISEATEGKIRDLTRLIRVEALDPPGHSVRLRIDCLGGGDQPSVISGYVDGQPVVSVAVTEGFDSFDAVGFWVLALQPGTAFAIDDAKAWADRPGPGMSPVAPVVVAESEAPPPGSGLGGFTDPSLGATPEHVLKMCLAADFVDAACPRRVLRVNGTYMARTWSTEAGRQTGEGWETLDISFGSPYLGIRRKNAPPKYAHLVIRSGDLTHASPVTYPDPEVPAQEITNRPARYRENVIPLGTHTWGGRTGVLILSPPDPSASSPGDHLVFRWSDGGIDYEISIHSWVPLDLARSMLESIVRSID